MQKVSWVQCNSLPRCDRRPQPSQIASSFTNLRARSIKEACGVLNKPPTYGPRLQLQRNVGGKRCAPPLRLKHVVRGAPQESYSLLVRQATSTDVPQLDAILSSVAASWSKSELQVKSVCLQHDNLAYAGGHTYECQCQLCDILIWTALDLAAATCTDHLGPNSHFCVVGFHWTASYCLRHRLDI